MQTSLTGIKLDGTGALVQTAQALEFAATTTVTINITVTGQNGVPINLTGQALVLSVRTSTYYNANQVLSLQATIDSAAAGTAHFTIPNTAFALARGAYVYDVTLVAANGATDQVVPTGSVYVTDSSYTPGQTITPLATQQPLGQGPIGPMGPPGTGTATVGASTDIVPVDLSAAAGASGKYADASHVHAHPAKYLASVAAARALGTTPPSFAHFVLHGYYAEGDGGGGEFYWNPTSVDADDGAMTLQITGVTTGRLKRIFNGRRINIKWWGAKCDYNGTTGTDDTAAVQAAINYTQTLTPKGGEIYVPGLSVIASHLDCKQTKGVHFIGDGTQDFTIRWPDLQTSGFVFTSDGTGLPVNSMGYAAFVDCRSIDGFKMQRMSIIQATGGYPGLYFDFSHYPNPGGADSANIYFDHCTFALSFFNGTEYPVSARAAISFSVAIECVVEKCSFFGVLSAIRGQEDVAGSIGYSNVVAVRGCQFQRTPTCIMNPGQSWIIEGNTAEGLGTATWYTHNLVAFDINDANYASGPWHIRNNWCGDAFGSQIWLDIPPCTNVIIENNLLEGGVGCIRFRAVGLTPAPIFGGVEIRNNQFSPSSGYNIDFDSAGLGVTWQGVAVVGNSFGNFTINNLPTLYTAFANQIAGGSVNVHLPQPVANGTRIPDAMKPTDIPNIGGHCLAWYKADALVLADGAAVATWPDNSGNGWNLTQATGAQQPTFHVNQQNSLPVVRFDGVSSNMTTPNMSLTTPCCCVVVFRANGARVANDTVLDGNFTGTAGTFQIFRDQADSMTLGGLTVGIYPLQTGVYALIASGTLNNSSTLRAADIVKQGNLNVSTFIHNIVVGRNGAGTNPIAMDLMELAFFDRYLYPDEINGIMNYMRAKWKCW